MEVNFISMSMKVLNIFIILFLSLILPSLAQELDNLRPIGYSFGKNRYHDEIRRILFDGISEFQVIQYLISPSFGGERVLVIEIDTATLNTFTIAYHESESNIFQSLGSKRSSEINVKKVRKPIQSDDVYSVMKLFNSALSTVCENNRVGIDGVSYYFSNMARSGKTWKDGTNIGKDRISKLIEVCNQLISTTKSNNQIVVMDKELKIEIENLTEEFKSN